MKPAPLKKILPKKCKACGNQFLPVRPMQATCPTVECAVTHGKALQAKKARAEAKQTRERIQSIKQRSQLAREAQTAFNAWIRERDKDLPCISCGRHHGGQWHAGHYLSTGARPELRFEPLNVWRQCQPCNTHLHGNLVLYRAELIRRIGLEKVEWLEGPHMAKQWGREELIELAKDCRARLRALKRDADNASA